MKQNKEKPGTKIKGSLSAFPINSHNPHGLKVGQEVYYVSNIRDRHKAFVNVVKVGRVWAELSNDYGRANLRTLKIDGGQSSSPGRVYLNEQAYLDQCEFIAISKKITGSLFATFNCTLDELREAAKLLGVLDNEKA